MIVFVARHLIELLLKDEDICIYISNYCGVMVIFFFLSAQEQGAPSAASHGVSKAINWVGNRVDTAVEATSQPTQASVGKYAILQIMTSDSGGRVDKHGEPP